MFYSLFSEVELCIQNNRDAINTRRIIDEFQTSQINENGILCNKLVLENINLVDLFLIDNSIKIYINNPLFRDGSSLLVHESILKILIKQNLPKHQIFSGVKIKDYFLMYFYYDYFRNVNFQFSTFQIFRKKIKIINNERVYLGIEFVEEVKFSSFLEFHGWETANKKVGYSERQELRFKEIYFMDEVYYLDVLPSNKLDFRLVASEKLSYILEKHLIEKLPSIAPIKYFTPSSS